MYNHGRKTKKNFHNHDEVFGHNARRLGWHKMFSGKEYRGKRGSLYFITKLDFSYIVLNGLFHLVVHGTINLYSCK